MLTNGPSTSVESTRWTYTAAAVGYGLPFLLVVYLALAGGGYDPVVQGQLGVACWWVLMLGVLVGVLPLARVSRTGWLALGLLAALAVWTALGISWSDSSERSVAELGRVAAFLGVFALAIAVQGRDGLRRTVYAVAAAIGVIAGLALLSRFHPELFPANEAARFLDDVEARLSYPLNSWNGLAALMAIGIPLALCVAMSARAVVVQAIAAAALPVMALTAFFTLSRGGAIEIAVAVAAFIALYPRRLAALPTLGLAAIGSAVLIAVATQKDALEDGLDNATAISQGNEMLVLTIVLCSAVGLGHVAAVWARQRGFGPRIEPSRRATLVAAGIVGMIVLVTAIGAGLPGKASDRLDEFTQSEAPEPSAGATRYESLSGNGRYQLWSSAVDANATAPLVGIGPGTFEFWWTQDRQIDAYTRTAHSLYLNALAELGIVGLVIVAGFVLVPLGVGIGRWRRAGPRRDLLAGAIAAALTFAVAAGIDWAWELAVLPVAFLLLVAAIVNPLSAGSPEAPPGEPLPIPARLGVAALAIAATITVAIPTAGLISVRESQADVRAGELASALDAARDAGDIQPYAATPDYQEAQILELQGDLANAAAAAREATTKEPTNWRTWLVLARIEAERGRTGPALEAFERARSLNPISDFVNQ